MKKSDHFNLKSPMIQHLLTMTPTHLPEVSMTTRTETLLMAIAQIAKPDFRIPLSLHPGCMGVFSVRTKGDTILRIL